MRWCRVVPYETKHRLGKHPLLSSAPPFLTPVLVRTPLAPFRTGRSYVEMVALPCRVRKALHVRGVLALVEADDDLADLSATCASFNEEGLQQMEAVLFPGMRLSRVTWTVLHPW